MRRSRKNPSAGLALLGASVLAAAGVALALVLRKTGVATDNFTPAQLVDPATGLLDLQPTDLIAVNSGRLARSLGASVIPGFAPSESVQMQIVSIRDRRVGPVMAISKDPKLTLTSPIAVQPEMIAGVQPADS